MSKIELSVNYLVIAHFCPALSISLPALFQSNWVPRRGDQGPKTIDQIHKDAELEEHREQMKVQQALISKKELGGGPGGRMSGGGPGGRGGPHTQGRGVPPQDEGWNTVPISKNRPIDTSRLSKITKVGRTGTFFMLICIIINHCIQPQFHHFI